MKNMFLFYLPHFRLTFTSKLVRVVLISNYIIKISLKQQKIQQTFHVKSY